MVVVEAVVAVVEFGVESAAWSSPVEVEVELEVVVVASQPAVVVEELLESRTVLWKKHLQ